MAFCHKYNKFYMCESIFLYFCKRKFKPFQKSDKIQ